MLYFSGFTQAKNPDRPETNEDRIVVIPSRLYAVIDGATDLSGLRYDDRLGRGAAGGHLAAQAVAEALSIYGAGVLAELPDVTELAGELNAAIAATYQRLGIAEEEIISGRQRFRAAFAGAFVCGQVVRLVALGDCSIRLNGTPVLEHHFPGDSVLSKARSAAWAILVGKGLDADAARPLARQFIVQGPGSSADLPAPLDATDRAAILETVRNDSAVLAACGNDPAMVDFILDAGLEGIRADCGRYNAMVLDGVSDASADMRFTDIALAEIETLELASDGYPSAPSAVCIAAWEAALAEADRIDPDRIGPFASTKGRHGKNFGDDRSILLISAGTL